MVIPATKAVPWSEDLPSAEGLQLFSLSRGQGRVYPRLRLNEKGIEARLHLLAQAAKVLGLLAHDRVDALLLLRREIEFVRELFAHTVRAAHVDRPRPAASSVGRRTESGRSKPTPTSITVATAQG